VNQMVGTKVSITSSRPNTTRHRILGVLHQPDVQVVFVDTPGLHRPRSVLGARLNETATSALTDVDMILVLVDATAAVGPGDRTVLERSLREVQRGEDPPRLVVVINKIDKASGDQILERLLSAKAAVEAIFDTESVEYFPVSARSGRGVEALKTHDELPHSISCRVTEWEWPHIRCEIIVERDSQKGIVIGKGGEVLKAVGTAVRATLPEGAYLDLHVKVEKHWQDRDEMLNRLGY
jgi:GTP-binding protein Era